MGSALNLPYYNRDTVETVWGLEPSEGMRALAEPRISESDLDVRLLGLRGEEIPLDDNSIDSIVLTYTLCTIPDWRTALDQMHRVLTPEGKIYFSEHGRSDDPKVVTWQDRINPVWNRIAGGCNLNRPIQQCLEEAGFAMESANAESRGAPKFATFTYWGVAVPTA